MGAGRCGTAASSGPMTKIPPRPAKIHATHFILGLACLNGHATRDLDMVRRHYFTKNEINAQL